MTVKRKKPAAARAKATAEGYTAEIAVDTKRPAGRPVAKSAGLPFGGYDELAELGQGNLEAVVHANNVLARGAEAIGKEVMDYAQGSVVRAAAATKALLGAKTLHDVVALQSDFAKSNLESFLANSAKLSELAAKVTSEAFEQLGERVNVTVARLARPAA